MNNNETIPVEENVAWKSEKPNDVEVSLIESKIVNPGDKILDEGCGFGANSNFLASEGVKVSAINIKYSELQEARNRANTLGVKVNYDQADVMELPFRDEEFDTVLDIGCTHMLETQNDQIIAARETTRVLKPGGYLLYFGFNKNHPAFQRDPDSPRFRNVEDVQVIYPEFSVIRSGEVRWETKPEENSLDPEHVGTFILLQKKE